MTKESAQEAFGREVKRRRGALGWTLEDLAARCGLTQTYLGTIENGRRDPSLSTILAVAKGFGIRPADLFDAHGLSAAAREMVSLFEQAPPELRAAIRAILRDPASKRKG